MKFIIKDANKKEVLITSNIKEAYEYLNQHILKQNLSSLKQIQSAINYDQKRNKYNSVFAFYVDEVSNNLIYLEVLYQEGDDE